MENTLINQDFTRAIRKMRSFLPFISFTLLIGTYLVSAIIMGMFHAQSAPGIGFKIAAFLVPLAIQAGRGTLVFFFQLNPLRMQSPFSFGAIAATVLLLLSICEAILVMLPYGLSWTISVATLMIIGWVIEIMLLRETQFATQFELFQNQEQWQLLKDFYVAREEMAAYSKTGRIEIIQSYLNKSEQQGQNESDDSLTLPDGNNENPILGNVYRPS